MTEVLDTSPPREAPERGFSVSVGGFEGPFDLLLQLISKHKLEVTELALHVVTDEFIAYIREQGPEWSLDEATEFLVVAATLLDLKAARLLPSGEVEDEEDLALLEARDLLFARLLQYRAYKEVAALLQDQMLTAARMVPRTVGLEPHFAELLPEVVFGIGLSLIGTFSDLIASALASAFLPSSRRLWGVALLSLSVGLVLQWVILSWLIVQSMRYNASRTLFRNLHFGFGSKQEQRSLWRELMRLLALGVLTVPSLGLLWPYFSWRWRRFQIRHRRFGATPFTFHATAADFRRLHLRALPLLLLALAAPAPAIGLLAAYGESERWFAPLALLLLLGIGMAGLLATVWSCWLEAASARLTFRSIRLGPLHFHCTWAAMELLKLRLTNSLALLFSLGLAWPWVRIRTSRYRLEGILISPAGALEGFLGGEVEQVSALAEGAFSMEDSLAGVIDISF